MQKYGKTKKGTQRWYCTHCKKSNVRTLKDVRTRNNKKLFLRWVLEMQQLSKIAESAHCTRKTLSNYFAQFWNSPPTKPLLTKHDEILMLDGKWVGGRHGAIALICSTTSHVRTWRFARSESHASWFEFVSHVPEPIYAIYVHRNLRGVRSHIINALPYMFTYVSNPHIPRTTNFIESAINRGIAERLSRHRGLPLEWQLSLVSYFLDSLRE